MENLTLNSDGITRLIRPGTVLGTIAFQKMKPYNRDMLSLDGAANLTYCLTNKDHSCSFAGGNIYAIVIDGDHYFITVSETDAIYLMKYFFDNYPHNVQTTSFQLKSGILGLFKKFSPLHKKLSVNTTEIEKDLRSHPHEEPNIEGVDSDFLTRAVHLYNTIFKTSSTKLTKKGDENNTVDIDLIDVGTKINVHSQFVDDLRHLESGLKNKVLLGGPMGAGAKKTPVEQLKYENSVQEILKKYNGVHKVFRDVEFYSFQVRYLFKVNISDIRNHTFFKTETFQNNTTDEFKMFEDLVEEIITLDDVTNYFHLLYSPFKVFFNNVKLDNIGIIRGVYDMYLKPKKTPKMVRGLMPDDNTNNNDPFFEFNKADLPEYFMDLLVEFYTSAKDREFMNIYNNATLKTRGWEISIGVLYYLMFGEIPEGYVDNDQDYKVPFIDKDEKNRVTTSQITSRVGSIRDPKINFAKKCLSQCSSTDQARIISASTTKDLEKYTSKLNFSNEEHVYNFFAALSMSLKKDRDPCYEFKKELFQNLNTVKNYKDVIHQLFLDCRECVYFYHFILYYKLSLEV